MPHSSASTVAPVDARPSNLRHFQPGVPGPGRPHGHNRVTAVARAKARELLDSPDYRKSLLDRIRWGTLPPGVEQMLWHYAYGKPKENITVTVEDFRDVADATDEELEERTRSLIERIRKSREAAVAEQLAQAALNGDVEVPEDNGRHPYPPDIQLKQNGGYRVNTDDLPYIPPVPEKPPLSAAVATGKRTGKKR